MWPFGTFVILIAVLLWVHSAKPDKVDLRNISSEKGFAFKKKIRCYFKITIGYQNNPNFEGTIVFELFKGFCPRVSAAPRCAIRRRLAVELLFVNQNEDCAISSPQILAEHLRLHRKATFLTLRTIR